MFVLHIKMSKGTYYQKHRDVILKRAKGYYENGKERLREQAKHEYRELPEEENNLKREYGRTRYLNISQEKKKLKIKRISKNYREADKSR